MNREILFEPIKIGSTMLPNRIVMAPMTRALAADGIPGDINANYYRRRAEGGVGLILSEGTVVDRPASRNDPGVPFFHGERALSGWKKVIDSVHAAGGLMGPQLWHTGASGTSLTDWQPDGSIESPSGLEAPGRTRGEPMSEASIADTIDAFVNASVAAKNLGFDTLELHGAHGYLIDQFFWTGTNQRLDGYGGTTIGERARFARELITAVRAAVGPDFPIILRVSQWKQQDFSARLVTTPAEMTEWLQPLVEAGVNVLHCSQRRFWEPEFPELDGPSGLNFAGWAKKLTGAATISVGSVGLSGEFVAAFSGQSSMSTGIDSLIQRMERDEFDLIAVGRALISDPDWVMKIRQGDDASLKGFDPKQLGELM
ncbi:NADH:flavin oxidoreductase [Agrobacterium tumefaciens]|uniref:NADH:flavin oxidoreductase n=1 Tax=Agrobacterium tumefaciens TaxID=358 RepID=UPI0005539F90|nr:NADH:flavin oxidoreductase [Agrobacterium tumefaciens]